MLSLNLRNSFRLLAFAAFGLPVPGLCPLIAQNPPAQVVPALPAGMQNPTKPEVQPSLDQDRDPIPSPDIAAPEKETAGNTPGSNNQITKNSEGVYTMHEDVDEVLLNCTVVDDKGRPVLDLNRNDFHITEDGAPQTASSFMHQDLPVAMGILIDSSGSMLDKRQAVDAAANRLLAESNPRNHHPKAR